MVQILHCRMSPTVFPVIILIFHLILHLTVGVHDPTMRDKKNNSDNNSLGVDNVSVKTKLSVDNSTIDAGICGRLHYFNNAQMMKVVDFPDRNYSDWDSIDKNGITITLLQVTHKCLFEICFLVRNEYFKWNLDCIEFNEGEHVTNYTLGSRTNARCSCKAPTHDCKLNSCQDVILRKNECARIYSEQNCSTCRFDSIDYETHKNDNPYAINEIFKAVALSPNCTLTARGRGADANPKVFDLTDNVPLNNILELGYDFHEFSCSGINGSSSDSHFDSFLIGQMGLIALALVAQIFCCIGIGFVYRKCLRGRGTETLFKGIYIKPEYLLIDKKKKLGRGQFGFVYQGLVLPHKKFTQSIDVAVKMVKPYATNPIYFNAITMEIKIMQKIGSHPNILNLIGASTSPSNELFIVLELCKKGSLRDFLSKNKSKFENLLQDNQNECRMYTTFSTFEQDPTTLESFSTIDLCKWSTQVASGMEFLASKNVVHIDLAARNTLLDEDRNAKIADFGLSRELPVGCLFYMKTENDPLPLFYMPPESIERRSFSTFSDCWSFGVWLWEIFSLGQDPHTSFPSNQEDLLERLKRGERLPKPFYANDEIYDKICQCWNLEPEQRPTFYNIYQCFLMLSSSLVHSE